jgi:hypothetical protein
MIETRETLEVGPFADLTESAAADPQIWDPPTLTTWKVEEETLSDLSSGADAY